MGKSSTLIFEDKLCTTILHCTTCSSSLLAWFKFNFSEVCYNDGRLKEDFPSEQLNIYWILFKNYQLNFIGKLRCIFVFYVVFQTLVYLLSKEQTYIPNRKNDSKCSMQYNSFSSVKMTNRSMTSYVSSPYGYTK